MKVTVDKINAKNKELARKYNEFGEKVKNVQNERDGFIADAEKFELASKQFALKKDQILKKKDTIAKYINRQYLLRQENSKKVAKLENIGAKAIEREACEEQLKVLRENINKCNKQAGMLRELAKTPTYRRYQVFFSEMYTALSPIISGVNKEDFNTFVKYIHMSKKLEKEGLKDTVMNVSEAILTIELVEREQEQSSENE